LRAVALNAGDRYFAWSGVEGDVFWLADLGSGRIRTLIGHRSEINSVAFSPSGDVLASASSDGTVRLWRTGDGQAIAVLSGHPESADAVAFSPDGRTLASLGTYQSLKFWNLATNRELATLPVRNAGSFISFAPDGSRLAVTLRGLESPGDNAVRIVEAPATTLSETGL
jgi:WD40 repeat protein